MVLAAFKDSRVFTVIRARAVICDKIELGAPAGVLALEAGDYVHMKLELLVLPRAGDEYELARTNANSRTLNELVNGMSTWERVQMQAVGGGLTVTAVSGARVESHYPVRVCATGGSNPVFEVKSGGPILGFVSI